jgi:hypothetical protein
MPSVNNIVGLVESMDPSRMLKNSAGAKKVEAQAKVEPQTKKVRSSLNLNLDLSLFARSVN